MQGQRPMRTAMASSEDTLFGEVADDVRGYGRHSTGILPSHILKREIRAKRLVVSTEELSDGQIQPASLDLRLGAVAHRVRASFLPGATSTVEDKLGRVSMHMIDIAEGAVLEAGCVYVIPLLERLELRVYAADHGSCGSLRQG
jgi:dCTP deaminase